MSAADRFETHGTRLPRPLSALSRPEIAARAYVLQQAIDSLWDITDRDGGEPFVTVGRAKVELILLRNELGARDRAEATAGLVRDIAEDGARSLARRSA